VSWTERTTALAPSDAGASDYWDGAAGGGQGAVYVYDWSGSAWVERTTALTASDAGASDYFGASCALSADGTVLAVGAMLWDGAAGSDQGAVYVFDWNGSSWTERITALAPSDAGGNEYFGSGCALSADGCGGERLFRLWLRSLR